MSAVTAPLPCTCGKAPTARVPYYGVVAVTCDCRESYKTWCGDLKLTRAERLENATLSWNEMIADELDEQAWQAAGKPEVWP